MLCAISGDTPQQPVVSRKSGNIYEKRLITSYISENGTEPTTGEALTVEDLLDVRTSQTVRPRPPTLTSIPALLGVFQEEWDALALEAYTLQQNLAQARQELSTALYQNDAAVRVIARLTKERDEAREALSKVKIGGVTTNGANGDSMQVDNAPLPEAVIEKITNTQERLMKTRRKRPVPEGWATADAISNYKQASSFETSTNGARFLSTNEDAQLVLVGGADGVTHAVSLTNGQISQTWSGKGAAITSGVWLGARAVVATSSGTVVAYEGQAEVGELRSHSAAVTGLSVHPSNEIFASASEDKSYALYDAQSLSVLSQVYTDSQLSCTQFHPDGHLLALGGSDGQIKFYDVKSGTLAGAFDTGAPVKAICFSENGTWIAAANSGFSNVGIWDLRKVGQTNDPIKTLEVGSPVESLSWDYTAQFLLVGGPRGVSVQQYNKSAKDWSEPLRVATPSSAVAWGSSAKQILSVNLKGTIAVLQS